MSGQISSDRLWAWGEVSEAPRLLHTMLRVRDVEMSLRFYRDGLGMKLLDRHDVAAGRFSILFLSFGGYRDGAAAIELIHNWDADRNYTHGTGYGHLAIGVPDVTAMADRLARYGGVQTTAPRKMMAAAPEIAFLTDPDGYSVELIQTQRGTERD